ncbi:hypothetical protein GUJ93_ZPchr0003g18186 [Zizania palustris]|uniref:Uncharacterized protein n=1 Tax=Zizania palustris TaxID=103762 RepID=A0A8J5RNS5_ZIZPA|nr:hypothetical protein GUJ93_ZPchr0003g18186 [Zizania palustris]
MSSLDFGHKDEIFPAASPLRRIFLHRLVPVELTATVAFPRQLLCAITVGPPPSMPSRTSSHRRICFPAARESARVASSHTSTCAPDSGFLRLHAAAGSSTTATSSSPLPRRCWPPSCCFLLLPQI